MSDQLFDWSREPFVLAIEDMARIMRRSVKTVRRQVHAKDFRVIPAPLARDGDRAPYQWARDKVRAFLERDARETAAGEPRRYFTKARQRREELQTASTRKTVTA